MIISNKKPDENQEGIIIYRQEPSKRIIVLENNYEGENERYFLSFPYIFFAVTYYLAGNYLAGKNFCLIELHICFGTDPELKKTYHAAFPNIFFNDEPKVERKVGRICIELPRKLYNSIEDMTKEFN